MSAIGLSAARLAELSRFVVEHAGFRPSTASEADMVEVWSRASALRGLPGDAADYLAGALVVLGYLNPTAGSHDSRHKEMRLGANHLNNPDASSLVSPERRAQALREIDGQGLTNLLRILPSSAISTQLIGDVLRSYLHLAASESTHVPEQVRLHETNLGIRIGVAERGAESFDVTTPTAFIKGGLDRHVLNTLARTWMTLLHSSTMNAALVPRGVLLDANEVWAPVGWSNLTRIPGVMTEALFRLVATIAEDSDCGAAVEQLLLAMTLPTESSQRLALQLQGYAPEARWLQSLSVNSPVQLPCAASDSPATVGILLTAQLCHLFAAGRATVDSSSPVKVPASTNGSEVE